MKSIIALSLLLVVSCASQKDKREIEEAAAHSSVKGPKELDGTIHEQIDSSENLSSEQKKELYKIIAENKKTATALQEKSFQFRSVLVKELLSGKVNPKRIKIIKNDIKKVESERLKNTFDTVEKISKIVNSHPEGRDEFRDHLIQFDRAHR